MHCRSYPRDMTPNEKADGTAAAPPARRGSYAQLALSCLAAAAAQLLLKRGASEGAEASWLGLSSLHSGWVWLGIVALIASLVWWLSALRNIPLSVASNLSGVVHVLVPLGCWLMLGETISPKRWIGILLVVAGVLVSAKPASAVEQNVEEKF